MHSTGHAEVKSTVLCLFDGAAQKIWSSDIEIHCPGLRSKLTGVMKILFSNLLIVFHQL